MFDPQYDHLNPLNLLPNLFGRIRRSNAEIQKLKDAEISLFVRQATCRGEVAQ
jgi:hypothetical protein